MFFDFSREGAVDVGTGGLIWHVQHPPVDNSNEISSLGGVIMGQSIFTTLQIISCHFRGL